METIRSRRGLFSASLRRSSAVPTSVAEGELETDKNDGADDVVIWPDSPHNKEGSSEDNSELDLFLRTLVSARYLGSQPNPHQDGHVVSWNDLRVVVKHKKKPKVLLDNMAGCTLPSQLTAIMGPSGAGKTTFLKAFTGRGDHEGTILLDGEVIEPRHLDMQRKIALVSSADDTLEGTATCFEAIYFSATLRLPSVTSDQEIHELVNAILKDLSLDSCQDTQIRYLSMGQRRRVSVAIELVVGPSILVCDEPTSGLDSYNASVMVQSLKKVAVTTGACVVISIHHPNEQLFEMLDTVVLLNSGRCMLQAKTIEIADIFAEKGFPVPEKVNPADWMLTVAQMHELDVLEAAGFFGPCSMPQNEAIRKSITPQRGLLRTYHSPKKFSVREMQMVDEKDDQTRLSVYQETRILLQRELRRRVRERSTTLNQLIVPFASGILVAVVLSAFGDNVDNKIEDDLDFDYHAGTLFFNFVVASFMAPSLMLEFAGTRPIFEREYRTGHYGLLSFAFMRGLLEMSISVMQGFLLNIISYFVIGFQARFGYYLCIFFTYAWAMTSLCTMLASAPADGSKAKDFVSLAIFPQFLLCGFFFPVSDLPSVIRWVAYLLPLTFAFRLGLTEEFSFCSSPSETDEYLLRCIQGLGEVLHDTAEIPDSSILTLTQTGEFVGREGISEYKALSTPISDPSQIGTAMLYDTCSIGVPPLIKIHSANATFCDVTLVTSLTSLMNPKIAEDDKQGMAAEVVVGTRTWFHIDDNDKTVAGPQHIFFTNPKANAFFITALNPLKIATEACAVLNEFCEPEYFSPFSNEEECISAMLALPLTELNAHENYVVLGNSLGCRGVHMGLAVERPDIHCPHLSFESKEDPNGKFKCDDKSLNNHFYNFSQDDLDFFERYSITAGFDPATASHIVPASERASCSEKDSGGDILEALDDTGALTSIDLSCFGYLQTNDATQETVAAYWCSIFALIFGYRCLSAILLRFQSNRVHR